MRSLKEILIVGTIAGLIWEFIAPLMKQNSITDYIDILCYVISTIIYWVILNYTVKKAQTNDNNRKSK